MVDRVDRVAAPRGSDVVDNTRQGWGIAAFVVALAITCWVSAWYIKNRTFHSPNDPTAITRGAARLSP